MQVLVRHDDNIKGSDKLTEIVTTAVEGGLERFRERITSVEVHFADENGPKRGGDDIRCTVEVRVEGHGATAVKHHASDLEVALDAAVEKMARMLDHQLGRIRDIAQAENQATNPKS
ncbi:MAG: ribosomal subunit interface protein [Myxococcales bacterium]|nr:ribosomal subunit interface protein [Myxococcales bacterium]